MTCYQSKCRQLAGTDYSEVMKNARKEYVKVQKLTKRQPYVRSKYFSKDKVFIIIFWNRLAQKRKGEQIVLAIPARPLAPGWLVFWALCFSGEPPQDAVGYLQFLFEPVIFQN